MNLDDEIRSLREKTNNSRRQFLEASLETCFIAIERAHLELSVGNTHEAQKEFLVARRGADVAERFLREAPVQMAHIEAKLADLRSALKSLGAELGTATF